MSESFDGQSFSSADLINLFQHPAEYSECQFTGIDVQSARLGLNRFIDCTFTGCNFSNSDFKQATFRHCKFTDCKLMGINWAQTDTLAAPEFVNCSLDYSSFQEMMLKKSSFKNCSLKEVDFSSAELQRSDFSGSVCTGAVFSRANLSECDFRGASAYHIELTFTSVNKAKFSVPEALNLLSPFGVIIE